MKRALLVSSLSLLAIGCTSPVMKPAAATPAEVKEREAVEVALPPDGDVSTEADTSAAMRAPGDYVVYRFSGSYRDSPITLTQQVVGYDHGYLHVNVTVDDAGEQERLRLRIGAEGPRKGELVSVARLEGDVQVPFGVVAYGKLMEELMLSADENAGLVDATRSTVDVAGRELHCDVSSYRVRVGAHEAVMTTLSSDDFAWGHIGGEIATLDGKLLYKAEIVDMGSKNTSRVATQEDIEIYEDDYEHFEE